jgi:hypothetical protein
MENNRIARYFVETIIGQPVESITVSAQEYTHFKATTENTAGAASEFTSEEIEKIEIEKLSIIRYDFVAIIRTPEGHKKVLIEIQKARNIIDIMRFRTYLAEQYKRKDKIEVSGIEVEEPLPVITIYLLGFKLPETDAVAIHVKRTCHDMIAETVLQIKSRFIECLTHDSYIVQIPQITGKVRTRLERLLSVFEQNHFIDEIRGRKEYCYDVDDENIRYILDLLYHTGADPETQKAIEEEQRSNEFWQKNVVEKNEKIASQAKELEEKGKELEEQGKELEEKGNTITELQQENAEQAKALAQQAAKIAELERKYGQS